ncbi:helix-turn-helix domain-containing protein [Vibrio jasicida]|uniref:helix-turn-helix domain-containing protein n=1 Tax=Vibrio jasicida TaxID=766224 RepID=UPI000CE5465F|nr:helix-turn-helix transcriptional regulator [Vibrio jasicida]
MTSNERMDWHRADIKAELSKRGLSLAELGRRNNLSSSTVKNALDKHYKRGEEIIAEALGTKPEKIWPSRYSDESFFNERECA